MTFTFFRISIFLKESYDNNGKMDKEVADKTASTGAPHLKEEVAAQSSPRDGEHFGEAVNRKCGTEADMLASGKEKMKDEEEILTRGRDKMTRGNKRNSKAEDKVAQINKEVALINAEAELETLEKRWRKTENRMNRLEALMNEEEALMKAEEAYANTNREASRKDSEYSEDYDSYSYSYSGDSEPEVLGVTIRKHVVQGGFI